MAIRELVISFKLSLTMSKLGGVMKVLASYCSAAIVFILVGCQERPQGTIFNASELVTLSEATGNAVYVVDERIADIGAFEILREKYPGAALNDDYAEQVIIPGLIEHHVHPFLGALAMAVDVIAIEDWHLPDGVKYGVRSRSGYLSALESAVLGDEARDGAFVTWGYHQYFHGRIRRADLDRISTDKPIIVMHRSFHEFVMNTAALRLLEISQADVDSAPPLAAKHMSIEDGHFAEQGAIVLTPKIMPFLASPERLMAGLKKMRDYLHAQGVTMIANPGAFLSPQIQQAKNIVFGADDSPFRSFFIPNAMFLIQQNGMQNLLALTEAQMTAGQGRLSFLPKQVKLFSDGAMYSLAMQMRDGYLDGHTGAWLMEESTFREAFQLYWDAGYQIHVHQTGDAGLDRILDVLEDNLKRNPRDDHRTVIVHFGVSQPDQVARIKRLGAIVSANPYYVTALSDFYSRKGLGFKRAQEMVRLGDVVRADIPVALHSDMPMAPAAPLFLMHQAINRINFAGKVAAAEQRLTSAQALRAVTIGAAYMMHMEKDYGSIEVGKLANFTVLDQNPLKIDAGLIKAIKPLATIVEGHVYPIAQMPSQSAVLERK